MEQLHTTTLLSGISHDGLVHFHRDVVISRTLAVLHCMDGVDHFLG